MLALSSPESRKVAAAARSDSFCACVVRLEGHLRAPVGRAMTVRVRALVRCGERSILLDLARVSSIDAAGVGELVRAYNQVIAAKGILRIVRAPRRVRQVLKRLALLEILSLERWSASVGS